MGISKKLRKYVLLLSLTIVPIPVYSISISSEVLRTSQKIQSLDEAYGVLEEEKSKLGIEDRVTLQVSEGDKLKNINVGGFCGINNDGYVIGSDKSTLSGFLIRHELYHIFRDGCKVRVGQTIDDYVQLKKERRFSVWDLGPVLKYYYLKETRANIYALVGLRL